MARSIRSGGAAEWMPASAVPAGTDAPDAGVASSLRGRADSAQRRSPPALYAAGRVVRPHVAAPKAAATPGAKRRSSEERGQPVAAPGVAGASPRDVAALFVSFSGLSQAPLSVELHSPVVRLPLASGGVRGAPLWRQLGTFTEHSSRILQTGTAQQADFSSSGVPCVTLFSFGRCTRHYELPSTWCTPHYVSG